MDEPTNHLDVDAREALIHSINAYEGAVILISHDRHLLEACADRLWLVRDGTVTPYDGDMESYRAECLSDRGMGRSAGSAANSDGARSRTSRQDQRREGAARRNELAPLRKTMTSKEKQVEKLTADIAILDAKLGDAELYERDPDGAADLVRKRGEVAKALERTEAEWLEASEAYETANLSP